MLELSIKDGLVLKQAMKSDEHFLRQLFTNDAVMRTQGGVLDEAEIPKHLHFIESHWVQHNIGHFILLHRGREIGIISLKELSTAEGLHFDLGFIVLPEFQNQGFATSAARVLIDYAVKVRNIKIISAMNSEENVISSRVLLKLGFRKKTKTRLERLGRVYDNVTYWEFLAE